MTNRGVPISDRSSSDGGPQLPATIVDRPDVCARLDDVLTRTFTMVTAPAGYGKSVLAAQWIRQRCPVPSAWIDLDRDDNDAGHVLTQIVDATARLIGLPGGFEGTWQLDDQTRLHPATIALFTEALRGCPESVLVIDGIRASGPIALFAELATALHNADRCRLHLLAIGRCAPPTELTPLELSGTVALLDADDLRLSPDDVSAVITAHSGREVDARTAADLAERLEGWMVGAVIVAMSHPPDAEASADELLDAASAGIEGYYTSEVFERVQPDARTFLLRTSCVDELVPELCDHLADRSDSHQVLWGMVYRGLPITRQSGRVGTFRYDRMFRAFLDGRLRTEDPIARTAGLRAAAEWYAERAQPFAAADCYRRLGDWEAVIDVVMTNLKPILEGDDFARLAELAASIPVELLREHVRMGIAGAWVLMMDGRVAAANELLSIFRPLLTTDQAMGADLVQATASAFVEDMTAPLAFAESALAAADEIGDDAAHVDVYNESNTDTYRCLARASALGAGAYAGWWERVRRHLVDIPADVAVMAPQFQVMRMRGNRALFMVLSGEVARGLVEAEQALTVAREAGLEDHRAAAEAYLALGEGLRLSGMFPDAGEPLSRALELAGVNDRHNLVATATASRVHLLVDTARPREALDVLAAYRAETRHHAPPHVSALLAAGEARAVAALGDYFAALRLVEGSRHASPAASVEVSVALAAGEVARARDVVGAWRLDGSLAASLRLKLAQALVNDVAGTNGDAMASMRSALRLVADHQLIQPVVECGLPAVRLLRRMDGPSRRDAIVRVARRAEALIVTKGSAAPRFTAREAAVLAHLDRGLTLPDVARELFLSVNTVKTYVKAIYRKLGATTRAEALESWRATLPPREHP